MIHNEQQLSNSENWATEWAEVRRTTLRNLKQQLLELRMQNAEPATIARVLEARTFVTAALRSVETASHHHAATLRDRLNGTRAS